MFIYFFIYFNTRTKHFNSDSRIYHHSYNLIYHFPSFLIILTFININNITRGFTVSVDIDFHHKNALETLSHFSTTLKINLKSYMWHDALTTIFFFIYEHIWSLLYFYYM